MTSSGALDLGRSAVAEHRWAEAYERLAEVDAADGLAAADLELFATAASLRGRSEVAVDALTRAHESYLAGDDAVGAARTAGWIAIELLDGEITRSTSWVSRGMRLAESLPEPSAVTGFVRVVPALAAMVVGEVDDAMRRFEEIAEIAERVRDRELSAIAALGSGQCLLAVGATAEGLARLDQAVGAVTAGYVSPVASGIIHEAIIGAAHEAFDLERAIEWTSAFDRWCGEQPDLVTYSGQCHAHRAELFLLHGAWDEASAAAELAEARFRAGDRGAAFGANYQQAELHRLRGELRAAEERYRRAGETMWGPQPGLALLRFAEGKVGDAQSEIHRSTAGADETARRHLLPALVEIELAAGDHAAARQAAEELGALSRTTPTPMLTAISEFAAAQVLLAEGDAASAVSRLRAAWHAWRTLDAPYQAARCRVLRGRALRALGDLDAATAEFDAARETFGHLGAGPALAELAELVGDRAGALTDREVEVLRLVSTGLTNRGVAARLSLSDKTVARHLSNIFGKLGLSSRAAATAYAYEHGLV